MQVVVVLYMIVMEEEEGRGAILHRSSDWGRKRGRRGREDIGLRKCLGSKRLLEGARRK